MASECILAIDDEPANLELLDAVLSGGGFNIRKAIDATTALAVVAECTPDLILMDLQLPDIDGVELTQRIRAIPRLKSVPIVAVTAFAMRGDAEVALAAGCDGYITKPIDVSTFLESISQFLPQSG